MGVAVRHAQVLRKAAVKLAAQVGGLEQRRRACGWRVQGGVDHDALAQALWRHALPQRHNAAHGIHALNTRKGERAALPAGLFAGAVSAFAGPDIGVVDATRSHFNQHLVRAGRGHGHIVAVLEFVCTAKTGEQHGPHVGGSVRRHVGGNVL